MSPIIQSMEKPTFINSNHDRYNHWLRYYPFMVNLDKCNGSCNTLDGPYNTVYVPNKTGCKFKCFWYDSNNMNYSKTLRKHILCECKCRFDGTKCSLNEK